MYATSNQQPEQSSTLQHYQHNPFYNNSCQSQKIDYYSTNPNKKQSSQSIYNSTLQTHNSSSEQSPSSLPIYLVSILFCSVQRKLIRGFA